MLGYRTGGRCPLDGQKTKCTENCKYCLEEEQLESLQYDVSTMIGAQKNEEETKCQNIQNLKPNTKPR